LPSIVPALVELTEVSRHYRMGEVEVRALDHVSFALEAGEMAAIMGASGSGKSTLLNVIGTLDRPDSGTYALGGVAVEGLDEEARAQLRNARIGFVFQAFNLLPRLTALENVELPMIYRGIAPSLRRRRAEAALARVGLDARMGHKPTELSGGQQQRVAIARAIVNEPALLLADEPTGALDTATTEQVMGLLSTLHAEGMTIAIVTHDPGIGAYAPRTITFRDGIIVADHKKDSGEGR